MLRKIFFTFSSRLFITGLNFLVILITARYLGAEGRGVISLMVLGITINLLVSNVFGGAALAFLAPRVEIFRLIAPGYSWAVIATLCITSVLIFIRLIPPEYGRHLFLLSLLQALYNIHLNVLVGKGLIRWHNLVNALQVSVLTVILLALIFIFQNKTVDAYFIALYSSLIFSFLLSLFFLRDEVRLFPVREWWNLWKVILKNGYIIQIASIAQLLNYRFSYYIMEHYTLKDDPGLRLVGVYSTVVAIAEAVWLIGRSMGLVQYSRIVKGEDSSESRALTIRFGRISLLLSALLLLPPLLIPASGYQFIFGPEFEAIPRILLLLVPGILSFAAALMYSNYFAAIGLNHTNLYASLGGLLITVIAGIFIIPYTGMQGAAITASASYLVTSIMLWRSFVKRTGASFKDFLPERSDLLLAGREFRKFTAGKKE